MPGPSAVVPVSVVIPAYNARPYLEETLSCLARQTVRPAEVIVVDDASTDGTGALAARLGARVLSFTENRGPSAARNAGVRMATQPWIAFLDADDTWLDAKLERQWAAVQRWPDAGFCFTDYDAVDANGARVSREGSAHPGYAQLVPSERAGTAVRFLPEVAIDGLIRSMFIRQSSVLMNRAHFMETGGYNETMRLAEDYELFLRISALAPIVSIEEALVMYRRRPDSLSADPLAEIRSIDRLWERMLEQPARYPAAMLARVRAERIPTLHRGAVRAMRLGRFTDARGLALKARSLHASAGSLLWYGVSTLLDSPAGVKLHRIARAIWQARHGAHSPS